MISLKYLLKDAYKEKYAIPAFNFENFDMLHGIVFGAKKAKSPVILQTTLPALNYLGLKNIVSLVRNYEKAYDIPVVLHLDHADDLEVIKDCINEGYTSVMIDYSNMTLDQNIDQCNNITGYASDKGVSVEAEVGIVETVSDKYFVNQMTDIEKAKKFCKSTCVDALGISIGNMHGMRKKECAIDYQKLKSIYSVIKKPLVLHGSSGIKNEDLKRLPLYGITKVNIETELRLVFRNALVKKLNLDQNDIKPRSIMNDVRISVEKFVEDKCIILGSYNRSQNFR